MIMNIANAGHANAAMIGDAMRGSFNDKLKEVQVGDQLLNSENMRNYHDMSLVLTASQQKLTAQKAWLEAQMAQAKNEIERQKLQAEIVRINGTIRHNNVLDWQIQTKIAAGKRLQQAATAGEELNQGDMALAGFAPKTLSPKDQMDADNYIRNIMTNEDGTIKTHISPNDEVSLDKTLRLLGQQLTTVELPKMKNIDGGWAWYDKEEEGRKLYIVTPKGVAPSPVDIRKAWESHGLGDLDEKQRQAVENVFAPKK